MLRSWVDWGEGLRCQRNPIQVTNLQALSALEGQGLPSVEVLVLKMLPQQKLLLEEAQHRLRKDLAAAAEVLFESETHHLNLTNLFVTLSVQWHVSP